MNGFRWHITPTVLLLLITVTAWCQGAKTVVLTKYTQSEGLSSYYITKIIRDTYGFMWVGTQEGLNRFDGKTFQVFSKQSNPKHRLVGSYIADLTEDTTRNLMWVLTSYAGINAIDINTRVVTQQIILDRDKKPLSEKWVRCLYVKGDTLWLGGHGILAAYSIKTNKWLDINIEQKIGMRPGDCNISKITFDRHGRLWVFSDAYGIAVLNSRFELLNTFRNVLANGFSENRKLRFWDLTQQGDNIYVATSWGLRLFTTDSEPVTYVPNRTKELPDRAEIQCITSSSANTLLFATTNRFYTWNTSTRQLQTWYDENRSDDWLTATFQVFYDSTTQKIWIGAQSGLGCFTIRKTPYTPFSKSVNSETTMRHAFSVLPVHEETIYCGNENGLFHINAATKEIVQISNASSNLLLFKDRPGNVFVSNKKGFFLLKDKKMQPAFTRFPCLQPLKNDQLSCGIQFNDSIILFGSIIQKGLTVWNTRSNQIKIYHKDSLQNKLDGLSIIDFLYRSKNGKAFILTEKSIIDFNPITGHYTTYEITNGNTRAVLNNFMDMCETANSYWIATYGNGLIETDKQFRTKRILTTKDGLSNNCVYRTFAFRDSLIIATTNNGLSVINGATGHISNNFQSDGLHADFFEQLCGYQNGDKIYAGGVNGFTIIEPEYFSMNIQSPKLYLDNIKIETKAGITDTSNFSFTEMTIPNNALQTTITFSALNYSNPLRITYAYKIEELNSDWINLGSTNFINLIGLAPGKYTMLVRASNEDGVWSEKPLQLSLLFLPHWYQTLLFKLLVLLITAFLFYSFARYRISQINKQQQIRKEIANDLHDDIGSTLNTVKIFTHLARRDPQNEDHLNQIEESLTQATLGLRDMIWVLDDNQDTIFELLERIKKFALPVCQANRIQFTCSYKADKNSKPVSKTEKRNLLLIAKEAINNSIKYANCRQIQVVAKQVTNDIQLTISDDGNGFDQSNVERGNGLGNIAYRANQISYKLQITSTIGQGTTVELKSNRQ